MKKKSKTEKAFKNLYVQEGLYEHLRQKEKPRLLDHFLEVIDLVNRRKFWYRDIDFVPLSRKALEDMMNWRNCQEVMDNLIDGNILERTESYGTGKCYGYRIREEWQNDICIFVKSRKELKTGVVGIHGEEDYQADYDNALTIVKHQYENLRMLNINEDEAQAQMRIWFEKFRVKSISSSSDPSFSPADGTILGSVSSSDNTLTHDWEYYSSDSSIEGYYTASDNDNSGISNNTISNINNTGIEEGDIDTSVSPIYVPTNKEEKNITYTYNQYNQDRLWIKSLTNEELTFSRDRQGRLNTNITYCPRRLRPFLKVEGIEKLCLVDISNSQPLLINILLKQHNLEHVSDVQEYKKATEEGQLYKILMQRLGLHEWKKDEFKEAFFKNVFYSKRKYPSAEGDVVRTLYPTVWEFVNSYKNTPRCTELARQMQREESSIMIDNVSAILNLRGIWHLTIHDAVLCDNKHKEEVKQIMKEQFNVRGLNPTIDSKLL
jgi:hypothetical protein